VSRPLAATGQRPRRRHPPAGNLQTRVPYLVGCPRSRV